MEGGDGLRVGEEGDGVGEEAEVAGAFLGFVPTVPGLQASLDQHNGLGFDPFAADYAPPGGESWQVFLERVARAWQRVREAALATPGALAVVTHGLVCGALVRHHLTLAQGCERPAGFGNTAVTAIEAAPPWRVTLLACTAHLEDAADGGGGSA